MLLAGLLASAHVLSADIHAAFYFIAQGPSYCSHCIEPAPDFIVALLAAVIVRLSWLWCNRSGRRVLSAPRLAAGYRHADGPGIGKRPGGQLRVRRQPWFVVTRLPRHALAPKPHDSEEQPAVPSQARLSHRLGCVCLRDPAINMDKGCDNSQVCCSIVSAKLM